VLIISVLLSLSGKYLIKPISKPSLDNDASNAIAENIALAIPTSEVEYNLAATIQKIKPVSAPIIISALKIIEFLISGLRK